VLEAGHDEQQSILTTDENDFAWAKDKANEQGLSKEDVPQPEKD